jgi:hypothetical protein
MKKLAVSLGSISMFLILSNLALADPAMVFEGRDRGDPRFACRVEISDVQHSDASPGPEGMTAQVMTNYSHGADRPEVIRVRFDKLTPDGKWAHFQGGHARATLIRVAIPAEDAHFERLFEVNVRWKHGNHFHVNTCSALKRTW